MICKLGSYSRRATHGRFRRATVGFLLLCAFGGAISTRASVNLNQISADPFTNATSQHATEVEPDTFSFGSTIVAAFQSGRFFDGGASDIGFATSTDGGATWYSGSLPGITKIEGTGPYDRVSDPAVAYDARHGVWLIASLAIVGTRGAAVLVSISANEGLAWQNPVTVAATSTNFFDKEWIACDNSETSPFYGNCYIEYDDAAAGNRLHMSTSTNGGITWTEASVPAISVIGGQPVTLPNGRVVVPMDNGVESAVIAVRSDNGGVSYSAAVTIGAISDHAVAGGLRTSPLPSAEVDGAGTIYVVWQDCRFRSGCASNDIVMSTSTDGVSWSPVVRIPIDPVVSGVDHFIPGIAADSASRGGVGSLGIANRGVAVNYFPRAAGHVAVTYYYYPAAQCSFSTCQLNVGLVVTADGGQTWAVSAPLNPTPMHLADLASTNQGRMVGDYISTSFSGGRVFGVFAMANPPIGGVFDEGMYTLAGALFTPGRLVLSRPEQPVPNAVSDHPLPLRPVTAF